MSRIDQTANGERLYSPFHRLELSSSIIPKHGKVDLRQELGVDLAGNLRYFKEIVVSKNGHRNRDSGKEKSRR